MRKSLVRMGVGVALAGAAVSACGDESTSVGGAAAGESAGESGHSGLGGAGGVGQAGAGEAGVSAGAGEAGVSAGAGGHPPSSGGDGARGGEGGSDDRSSATCGDGVVEGDETCDDQNNDAADGCAECAIEPGWACDDTIPSVCAPEIVSLDGGGEHTCAALGTGQMLCWGRGETYVQTGYNDWHDIGDDETPASVGPLGIDSSVREVALGFYHTCALLTSGAVRCWGDNGVGQLGYASQDFFQDASTVEDVDVGGPVQQVVAGFSHTCALLTNQKVRCWGSGAGLGYGTLDDIGDNETPASAGDVDIGGPVQQLSAGDSHTCALLTTGAVRCWGSNYYWQLGYPDLDSSSGDQTPADLGDVDIGGAVQQIAAGSKHTCALLTSGKVRCWGSGVLGYGNDKIIGDDEPPAAAGDVDLGVLAEHIVAGADHTCALTAARTVHCWGADWTGACGYATWDDVGDNELPSSKGAVNVGGPVGLLAAGGGHTCAVLPGSKLRCWGYNNHGQLGYGHKETIGNDEHPASVGFVEYH